MDILGISCGYHDAAATVIRDGNILFAGHAERYSKVKNDSRIHHDLMSDVFEHVKQYQFDTIAYYEKPWLKVARQLYSDQPTSYELTAKAALQKNMGYWPFPKNIPVKSYRHHLSHAAAGFQTSGYMQDATVVVIDAIGEWDTASIWHAWYDGEGIARYKLLWKMRYPNSLGLLYSAVTKHVDLKPLEDEYILMGMAAYGTNRFSEFIKHRFVQKDNLLQFRENVHAGLDYYAPVDMQEKYDWAASAQDILEQQLHLIFDKARKLSSSMNLVYGGGVALNCLANRMLHHYFQNVWIMPNPGDAGSSLGAAALTYGRKLYWEHPYLGHEIKGHYPWQDAVKELKENKIVGVANGRAEFGPRALGNRSLFADPRDPTIKDKVNAIKRRQEFRPFAPAILAEEAHKYFAFPHEVNSSPYMQNVAKCLRPDLYPAIVHKDGTSRVQTVDYNCGSGIRSLLQEWKTQTGCPMLLNTSLNIKGEPIVNDEFDAHRFATKYTVKVLTNV